MTATTELGKKLRMLRLERDEKLLDMAKVLDVSASFLSAVEKGHKSPPQGFEDIIGNAYKLSPEDFDAVQRAADRSREAFTLKPTREAERDTVGLLARRMSTLSDGELERIQQIIKDHRSAK